MGTHSAQPRCGAEYHSLDAAGVIGYLRDLGSLDRRLGGGAAHWRAYERGDGNLNLIFVVQGPAGAIVVKQALPYVRMVGESWPLSLRRNYFEHAALREHARWVREFVPVIYHADHDMALIAMEFLSPHAVLRTEFVRACIYPLVGVHLGRYLARTSFNTSDLRLSAGEKKAGMAVFLANTAMCKISEDLIFDEPYFAAPMNRHTSPQLDAAASGLRRDTELKVAVQAMKWRFMNQPECLIHGDLHTGSVMVTADDTRVIDPEFAFYGPMGFDIGVLLANFLMAYFSQPGHAVVAGEREVYRSYLLEQLTALWITFASEFSRLWRQRTTSAGDVCNSRMNLDSPDFSGLALGSRLQEIWGDALGFAGCEIIRRIVGLAHVADFETIADPARRAGCEQRAVGFARGLLMERSQCRGVSELTAWARACT